MIGKFIRELYKCNDLYEYAKFEAGMIRRSEALAIQLRVNSRETVKMIEAQFGPFSEEEIEFYRSKLKNEYGNVINSFQGQIIFNLFYKYFRDTSAIHSIDSDTDYIKLMLAAKKILQQNYMVIMPYVISGKVEKLVTRKTINKKEEQQLKTSPYYPLIVEKYRSEKVITQILSTVATVISSNFRIIDYNNKSIDGKIIDTIPNMVMDEMLSM